MPFTDDELETTKRQHRHTSSKTDCRTCALIRRLEAAERFIDHSFMLIEREDHPDYIAWLKSAGLK